MTFLLNKKNNDLIKWTDKNDSTNWDVEIDVLIVGCGGCGLVAGLAAAQKGAQVFIVEKLKTGGGNTSLGQGMFPAAGSKVQKDAGIDDSPEQMAMDIQAKNLGESDPDMTLHIARETGRLVDWLDQSEEIHLDLVTNFLYPGHSRHRIHAPKTTDGSRLVHQLTQAATQYDNLFIAYGASVRRLIADPLNNAVLGAEIDIQGTGINLARATKTILACNGFASNKKMVDQYIPEMSDALYFGSEGNTGEGILWGEALGGELVNMQAYQGHGSVAHPHGTLLTWAVISLGGYQVNRQGKRFVNENQGYSEHALDVLSQDGEVAIEIFDQRIFDEVQTYEDFQKCIKMGAVKSFSTMEELAAGFRIDPLELVKTHNAFQAGAGEGTKDSMGRRDVLQPLSPPYYGVQVTGALFHTQGGLNVDKKGQVLTPSGIPVPNLYAGGGTAVGLSGNRISGYLSGNGLLSALTFGLLAGENAAKSVMEKNK